MPVSDRYHPDPIHPTLGDVFFDVVSAARFPLHVLRYRNQRWAERVGLDTLTPAEWEAHFARFEPLPGNLPQPLALRYHGHQFRSYNPNLGDGRGFLFAQLRDVEGRLLDLATKGSGQTPWSRGGDGRLTLKGGVREVLATSMLDALGVPTSQSFSLFETGESLQRGDEPSPTRSSVLVRLGHSHVRFGTFQRLFHHGDVAATRRLVEFAVTHYLPEAAGADDLPVAMLRAVTVRSARLAAAWMAAGFVHGVLNTDNMNVTGESFDYGPYRFLPTFDPGFTAAYFDAGGLYAYGRQPATVQWNLERLADALTPLAPQATLATALAPYATTFREAFHAAVLTRLGVASVGPDEDAALVATVLAFLRESQIGVDRFFFDWHGGTASAERAAASPAATHWTGQQFDAFRRRVDAHAPIHPDRLSHPYYQGTAPCSLLIDEIETVWSAIADHDNWGPFEAKLAAIEVLRTA
ncbi:MAG TPA: YdiU family protein [Candidatus Binatia bacterium]|nr:YdiU family protein [Candidatus Binatia bacterium]